MNMRHRHNQPLYSLSQIIDFKGLPGITKVLRRVLTCGVVKATIFAEENVFVVVREEGIQLTARGDLLDRHVRGIRGVRGVRGDFTLDGRYRDFIILEGNV